MTLRACVWVTLAALAICVVAMVAAVSVYPGGSWTELDASGFSLARNFWCDLLRSKAINGAENGTGKWLASVAFGALGIALWPYWWVAASVLTGPRRTAVALMGTLSAASLAALALLPSDRQPIWHGVVALSGGLLGIGAALLCVSAWLPSEPRFGMRRVSGGAALLLGLLNAALYVHVAYAGGQESMAQPVVQKLATLALVAWMLSTIQRAWLRVRTAG